MNCKTTIITFLLAGAAATATCTSLSAQEGARSPVSPYLLDMDPVTGAELGDAQDLVIVEHDGRELRFGNQASAETFRADPPRYLAVVHEAIIRQQGPRYPLETCVVSGEKLGGAMGDPIDIVSGNRLVRFCCAGCKPTFAKDPAKYLGKLDAAVIATQLPDYPLGTCVISGEELGGSMGKPVDVVIGDQLVRLCCKGCKERLVKNSVPSLRMVDAARDATEQDDRSSEGRHEEGERGAHEHLGHGCGGHDHR